MTLKEFLTDPVALLLLAIVAYGLWQTVRTPAAMRRFYRKLQFERHQGGELLSNTTLEGNATQLTAGARMQQTAPSLARSTLLSPLATRELYGGEYQQRKLWRCVAYPAARRRFTLSRRQRQRNQARWSMTVYPLATALPEFCARPTNVNDALEYVFDDSNMQFADDDNFNNRYHVLTPRPDQVRELLPPAVRELILKVPATSVESTGDALIIKRVWEAYEIETRMQRELDEVSELLDTMLADH